MIRRRRRLAARFLRGEGLEVGALHQPLPVPPEATVTYVDRLPNEALRGHYPELSGVELTPVQVVDDGEALGRFEDASQDFVIANHFIEHTQDPIGALENHLRVLRPGGILYLAAPDKRRTFDRDRPETTLEHLDRDHREGPARSRRDHYLEWAEHVNGRRGDEIAVEAERLMDAGYSIHFHVWTRKGFLELLEHCRRDHGLPFEIAASRRNGDEFIVVLRRD